MRRPQNETPARLKALGLETALGSGAGEIWPRLLSADPSGFSRRSGFLPGRTLLVGDVKRALPKLPRSLADYDCRNNALTLATLEPMEAELRDALRAAGPGRVGVVMGTSTSGASDTERALAERHAMGALPPWWRYAQLEIGGVAGFVAEWLGACGPCYAISTACSAGARALVSARSLLAMGLCDVVVCGATDTLCGLTTNGFASLHALSDEPPNPFSVNRKGLVLSEGSAVFLMTRETGGIQLSGVGESSEAHHMSAPDPEGSGAEFAMREALADAGLRPGEIAYLNLHGTATPQNDVMEGRAVARLLGGEVPVSSTKGLVGHALGAAGAIEAAFCWMMLQQAQGGGLLPPPHAYDGAWDPSIPKLRLVESPEPIPVAGTAHVLSNSFGFGGNNCTLLLSRDLSC